MPGSNIYSPANFFSDYARLMSVTCASARLHRYISIAYKCKNISPRSVKNTCLQWCLWNIVYGYFSPAMVVLKFRKPLLQKKELRPEKYQKHIYVSQSIGGNIFCNICFHALCELQWYSSEWPSPLRPAPFCLQLRDPDFQKSTTMG